MAKSVRNLTKEECSNSRVPTNAEEYLENGSIDEESGDRWLGSDLSKALRFYQKAYESYLRSIAVQPTNNLDSYYNASRLLFHVYNQYSTSEGVVLSELTNIDETIRGGENSVLQDLPKIVVAHERALEVATRDHISPPIDLLFNCVQVYTEVIENDNDKLSFDEILLVESKAQNLLEHLLTKQVEELQNFIRELQNIDDRPTILEDTNVTKGEMGDSREEEYMSEEVLQPPDILESVITAYKLINSILEHVSTSDQIRITLEQTDQFLRTCDKIAVDIKENFDTLSNKHAEMLSSITDDQNAELEIQMRYRKGLLLSSLDDILNLWKQAELSNTCERYMTAADNIQNFIDRNDLSLETAHISQQSASVFWRALSEMSRNFKAAQDLLNENLAHVQKFPSGKAEGQGELILKVSSILIARADVDLQRSMIDSYEPSLKNKKVLMQNCKTLLINAMKISNTPGGLRERASEKLKRDQTKKDAVLRMCLLENKKTETELDEILGRDFWKRELPTLLGLDYYAKLYKS